MRISDWSSDVCSSDLRHLEQHAKRIADIVRMKFGKAFGAIAALKQKSLALCRAGEVTRQVARLAGKDQRRIARKLALRRGERGLVGVGRSEEHTSELQSLMRISYAVFCLKKKKQQQTIKHTQTH